MRTYDEFRETVIAKMVKSLNSKYQVTSEEMEKFADTDKSKKMIRKKYNLYKKEFNPDDEKSNDLNFEGWAGSCEVNLADEWKIQRNAPNIDMSAIPTYKEFRDLVLKDLCETELDDEPYEDVKYYLWHDEEAIDALKDQYEMSTSEYRTGDLTAEQFRKASVQAVSYCLFMLWEPYVHDDE